MMRLQLRLRCAGILLALLAPPCLATNAYLHPQAIFEGDITELVIEYDSRIPSLYSLDSNPLQADFEILDIKSRVIRLDQGVSGMHRMQWRLQLLPRGSGRLRVPSLSFGNQSTSPLTLEVKPVPGDMQSSQEVFVEFDSQPRSPYVGQQTRLILRLFHNTPLRIDGLAEPRLGGVGSYRDNEEQIYFINREGREFRVLERQILLFPREAGTLELPPVVLRGQLRQQSVAADEAESGQRKISRSSNPLSLQVRAPPAAYDGRYWLPARDLVIADRLQPHAGELRIGDSVDWLLTLEAKGLPAASLPENLLEFESENFTVYADRAKRSERVEAGELIGRLEQRFAVIVTAGGEIELPAVSLSWWDLDADRERQARLSAQRIGAALAGAPGRDRQASVAADGDMFFPAATTTAWAWPLLSLAAIGLLLLLVRPSRRLFERIFDPPLRRRRIRGLLKQACLENRAGRARSLMIEWSRLRWPEQSVHGLYQVRERVGPGRLADELARLDAALFARGDGDWHGRGLWTAVASARRAAPARRRDAGLPGLYPG